MSMKCLFRNDDGSYCKRWAEKNSNFCHAHRPPTVNSPKAAWPGTHPFTRLALPNDLFDLLRESLNAARMGTMPPGQAASIATLSYAWLKAYDRLHQFERTHALQNQILPTLVDAESAADAQRVAASTDETERAADLIAELDHIAQHGPPRAEGEPPLDSADSAATYASPDPHSPDAAATAKTAA